MLNLILIFGMLLNLTAGLLVVTRFDPVIWGKRGIFPSRKAEPSLEWDHNEIYQ